MDGIVATGAVREVSPSSGSAVPSIAAGATRAADRGRGWTGGVRFGPDGRRQRSTRRLAEEKAVALVHDGSTTAVLMATPSDLLDFAVGFSLTERIVAHADQVRSVEVVEQDDGIEVRIWLVSDVGRSLARRRRQIAGPTGCGLCGIESLAEAARPPRPVFGRLDLSAADVGRAVADLSAAQSLGRATRATHAAALWSPVSGLVAIREDVGRHNALDKLAGAALRAGIDASGLAVVVTSRLSVEMVQKTAAIGAPILIAVSAPTTLAIETAEAAGLTLVAVARDDGFEVFTHVDRISPAGPDA